MIDKCTICEKEFQLNATDSNIISEPFICDDCKVTLEELSDGKGDDDNE